MPKDESRLKPLNGREHTFFCHKTCEAFPCHETDEPENFNCLFCYCPLYALGNDCGGSPRYLDNGVKDCSDCTRPHIRENYDDILARFGDIVKKLRELG